MRWVKKIEFRHKTQRVWFVSYLFVFLLPVVSWLIAQLTSENIIRKQTEAVNESLLNVYSQSVDSELLSAEDTITILSSDHRIQRHIRFSAGRTQQNSMTILDIKTALAYQRSLKKQLVSRIYLFVPLGGYIVSDGTVADVRLFYDTVYHGNPVGFEDWLYHISGVSPRRYARSPETGNILLIKSISVTSASGIENAALVIELSGSHLDRIVAQMDGAPPALDFIGPDGVPLRSAQIEDISKYAVSTVVSKKTGWSYRSYLPEYAFSQQSLHSMRVAAVAFFVALAGGLCMMIYFTRRNYNPLRELVTHIHRRALNVGGGGNDYDYLKDAFDAILIDSDENKTRIREHLDQVRASYLAHLMLGSAHRDTRDYLQMLGFDFSSQRFAVLLVRLDENLELQEVAGLLKIGTMEDSVFYGFATAIADHIAFLVDCTDFSEEEYVDYVYEAGGLSDARVAVLAASDIHEGLPSVTAAYDEALYVLHYIDAANSAGPARVTLYKDIKNVHSLIYLPEDQEQRLVSAIKSCNLQDADRMLSRIWDNNLPGILSSPMLIRFLTVTLINAYLRAMNEIPFAEEAFELPLDTVLTHAYTAGQARDELGKLLSQTIDQIETAKAAQNDTLKERVMAYVDEHCDDVNLSVEQVCQHFRRSVSGISRMFRSPVGNGLLQYINRSRISRAKQIMQKLRGDIEIKELSLQVGYLNVNTFIRQFKTFEGVTPGQYRELSRTIKADIIE